MSAFRCEWFEQQESLEIGASAIVTTKYAPIEGMHTLRNCGKIKLPAGGAVL